MKVKEIKYALCKGTLLKGAQGNYRILRAIGQGTFGITYLAEILNDSSEGSGMLVCIKEFFMRDINGRNGVNVKCSSDKGTYENYMNKFEREAKNLSELRDEHIVRIIECFKANNTVYYVMSYIAGGSLDELIESKGRLSELQTLRIAITLAYALSKMHAKGLVHLDVKPSNVMMLNDREIVLIDFGLSKHFDTDGKPESSTSVGPGTEGYAPMEQAHYRGKDNNPWPLDIYALGGTLFKMLTGRRPQSAADVFNNGFNIEDLTSLGISNEMAHIVMRAMEPLKSERYQTAAEVMNDLNSLLKVREAEEVLLPPLPPEGNGSAEVVAYKVKTSESQDDGNVIQKQKNSIVNTSNYRSASNNDKPKDNSVRRNNKSTGLSSFILIFLIAIVVGAIVYFGVTMWNSQGSTSNIVDSDSANIEKTIKGNSTDEFQQKELTLQQTEGYGFPGKLFLSVDGENVKGVWKTRYADIKVTGTYLNGRYTLKSRTSSATITLQENSDGELTGSLTGMGNESKEVTFIYK
ncbi:MAG: serine/threonine protein kinase [Prevotella sp.]|nr:serine/threonine protein kinase [Bacteroides sp.]MCM1366433.1 serine/threonine protein kinase [Prevotella sp.]